MAPAPERVAPWSTRGLLFFAVAAPHENQDPENHHQGYTYDAKG